MSNRLLHWTCGRQHGKSLTVVTFQSTPGLLISPASGAGMRRCFQWKDFRLHKFPAGWCSTLADTKSRQLSNVENAGGDTAQMYGKIYESTFSGSMVGSGSVVFSIWAYVIAHTKPDSMVELNPSLLSAVLGESEEKITEGIKQLCSPDPKSRSKAHEGRRLLPKSEFLFFVPRYKHYHGLRNDEERRQYFREKKREQRERLKACPTGMSNHVQVGQTCPPLSTQSESEAAKGSTPLRIPSGVSSNVFVRFKEWMQYRRGLGKKPKDWDLMFQKQLEWLAQFSEKDQIVILDQSMRNGWQGLFVPRSPHGLDGGNGRLPECLKFSHPRDWQEARRVVRFLEGCKSKHPNYAKEIQERIDSLQAQFKL